MAGLLALYFRTKLTLTQFLVFYSLPAFLISGYIWPEQAMPGIIRFLAWLQPLHYAMVDFRQLALTGQSATWGIHACLLAGAGVIAAFFTLKYNMFSIVCFLYLLLVWYWIKIIKYKLIYLS